MANRYANLPGPSKIKDTYDRINTGFDKVQQDIDGLQADLDKEITDREQAVDAVDQRIDQIIQGGGPDKDAELVDIRTTDPSYTPGRTINVAGDVTRDMQAQFMSHKAETTNWQRYQFTADNGTPKGGLYSGDMNALIDPGLYGISSATNRPVDVTGNCIVTRRSTSQLQQMYLTVTGSTSNRDRVFLRTSMDNGESWSDWVELINSNGGTMTGSLAQFTKADNDGRMALSGGMTASSSNGAHIIIEGKDYSGVDAGGSLRLLTAAEGSFYLNAARVFVRAGAPDGVVAAPVGSLYLRTDGGTSTTLYVKTSGSGNTGWKAVQTL